MNYCGAPEAVGRRLQCEVRCVSGCAATHVEGTGPALVALCSAPQEPRGVATVWALVLRARMGGWSREYATTALVTGIVLIPCGRRLESRRARARASQGYPVFLRSVLWRGV